MEPVVKLLASKLGIKERLAVRSLLRLDFAEPRLDYLAPGDRRRPFNSFAVVGGSPMNRLAQVTSSASASTESTTNR